MHHKTPGDSQVNKEKFEQNREAVIVQLEAIKVKAAIKEFYSVQHIFHDKMNNLVQACSSIIGKLPADDQQLLERLLEPYGRLIYGPFKNEPTGDLQEDILHITSVISDNNTHFLKTIAALFEASANLKDFNALLGRVNDRRHEQPELKAALIDGVKSRNKVWGDVMGHVSMPFQNMMRYEMLLRAIAGELAKVGYPPTAVILKNIMKAVAVFNPALQVIDPYQDSIVDLIFVDAYIDRISKFEIFKDAVISKGYHDSEKDIKYKDYTFQDAFNCIRVFIAGQKNNLIGNTYHAVDIHEGLLGLLTTLRKDIKAPIEKWRENQFQQDKYYLNTGYHYLVKTTATLFGKNVLFDELEKDPLEKLDQLIAISKTKLTILREKKKTEDLQSGAVDLLKEKLAVVCANSGMQSGNR